MPADATDQFVLDASVAVAWCFDEEASRFTEKVLDLLSSGCEALVPSIWPLEVSNALLVAERRNRIVQAKVTGLLRHIAGLPITVMPISALTAFEQILALARQHRLSQYDAAYLELALRMELPLATLDAELQRAARQVGVALIA
jgi:predicted nucleic acid-binding protein